MPPNPDSPGNLEYIINLMRSKLADAQTEVTGSISNISQAILDVWEMDCGGKWVVYVNTGTVALTKALWLLLTPSLGEILENYLEPKPGRRGGRRGQRGRRERRPGRGAGFRLFFKPPIPDIDNAIANLIPGHSALAGRRVGPGEYIFWTGINVADAILWHWLLLEATETFSVTWQSELMQSGECKALNDSSFQCEVIPRPFGGSRRLWQGSHQFSSFFEENMSVGNHGDISLPLSTAEGTALIICEVSCTLTHTTTDQPARLIFGPTCTVRDHDGIVIREHTDTVMVTAPPGGVGFNTAYLGILVEEFHSAVFECHLEGVPDSGGGSRSITSRTSIAVRNLKSV